MANLSYKDHKVYLQSHKLDDGRWAPKALIHKSTGPKEFLATVMSSENKIFDSEQEANAEARILAITWIDSKTDLLPISSSLYFSHCSNRALTTTGRLRSVGGVRA